MALSPDEIEGREFALSRRGYNRDEVDEFLVSVADTVREAEAAAQAAPEGSDADTDAAEPPEGGTHPLRSRLQSGPADTDDYGRLGAEVAAVLRTADEGAQKRRSEAEAEATRIRDEADGYAHRLRTETEAEAERVRAEAEVEARNARTALEEATDQARLTIQRANDEAESLRREAEESAGVRRRELLAEAEHQADRAAGVERDVHGRLLSVRDDLDQAVARLDPEATAAAAAVAAEQASALDPSDTGVDEDPSTRLGQGPPTPPVPPPPAPEADEEHPETEDGGVGELPYAEDDEPLDESPAEEDADDDTGIPPVPPPPPPPPGYESSDMGVDPDDLPYASDDDEAADGDETGGAADDSVIDLRDSVTGDEDADGADEDTDDEDDGDPLAAMVRDAVGKAVQGSTRRKKDQGK
jgi:DivIVA domain-containing protein